MTYSLRNAAATYVVTYKVKGDRVEITDNAKGGIGGSFSRATAREHYAQLLAWGFKAA